MHAEAYAFVARVAQAYAAQGPVYEIGSRNINGTVRGLFTGAGVYLGVDVVPGPGVDVIADAAVYDPPVTPQTVVCCEVLEHAETAASIVAQAARVLGPGGLLILTMASEGRDPHSAVDGGPVRPGEFYRNVPVNDVEQWTQAAGLEALGLVTDEQAGDLYYVGRKRGDA